MTSGTRIGILGGTFDPVHLGHVETALAAARALALDRVLLLPSGVPPHHRAPVASRFHRFAMTALAVTGVKPLAASDVERRACIRKRVEHAEGVRTSLVVDPDPVTTSIPGDSLGSFAGAAMRPPRVVPLCRGRASATRTQPPPVTAV